MSCHADDGGSPVLISSIIGGLLIGLCLGLLGSGGSILTVPLLVYLLEHDPKSAIGESLAIVGGIALIAAIRPCLQRRIDWPSVVLFGIPGVGGTVIGVWGSQFISGEIQLLIFAVVMLLAAGLMLRGGKTSDEAPTDRTPRDFILLVLEGLFVGILTGVVGVGGGFLIVPALVLFGRLPMKMAVGTSLLIIALKSGAGFLKSLDQLTTDADAMNLSVVATFILIGGVGSLIGGAVGSRIPQQRLKQIFAIFLLVMAGFILIREGGALVAIDDIVSGRAPAAEGVDSN